MSTQQLDHRPTLNAIIRRAIDIYRWTVYASFAVIGIGVVLAFFRNGDVDTKMGNPGTIIRNVLDLDAAGFFGLGISIMIVAPIVMIATSAATFFRAGDQRYGLISTAVAVILSLSIVIAFVIG